MIKILFPALNFLMNEQTEKSVEKRRIDIYLSKTRIKQGLQCLKSLYFQIYHSDLADPYDLQKKALFEQGDMVHRTAYKSFSKKALITAPYWDFDLAKKQTQQAIQNKAPVICEAFFSDDQINVRVDILQIQSSGWDLIEVKSASSVKKDHIWDVAVQKYILNKLKYKMNKCFVMYINRDCVYPDLKNLFIKKDVTEEAVQLQNKVDQLVHRLKKALSKKTAPKVGIGPHCHKPYPCRFISHCWRDVPSPSVFNIPAIGEEAWEYYSKNQIHLNQIPKTDLSLRQIHYQSVQLDGKPYIDKENIKKEILKWKEPFYYLDFETISAPIPRFNGVKPFQHIPFQFSLLKQNFLDKEFQEEHYLHPDTSDPRFDLAKKLVEAVGETGSVAAYYKNFESARLKELADLFPQFKEKLLDIESRLVDPLPLLQQYVCFKEFGSSWSMKSVAPVLLGDKWDYSKLEVQDGLMAQNAFQKMSQLKEDDPQKEKMKKDLIEYCRQDTLCLALIIKWLKTTCD